MEDAKVLREYRVVWRDAWQDARPHVNIGELDPPEPTVMRGLLVYIDAAWYGFAMRNDGEDDVGQIMWLPQACVIALTLLNSVGEES